MKTNSLKTSGLSVKKSIFLNHQLGVVAQKSYKKGELLFIVNGPIKSKRSKYSFAIDLNRHIEPRKEKGVYNLGHYVNHSCNPTAVIRIIEKDSNIPYIEVIARRNIKIGEEITFDYATLEYELTLINSICKCDALICRGTVQGFKDLPNNIIKKYKKEGIIADYLLQTNKDK